MNFLRSERFLSLASLEEEILIKKLLLSHDPDGRRLDSELLLTAVENIMFYATPSQVSDQQFDASTKNNTSNIEVIGSQEPLGHTIYEFSHEILCKCSGERDLHSRTMILFDLLGNYRWDAKMVLVLAAFATSYGEFWLIMQLYHRDPLAASIAMLKRLPSDISMLKPRFKALRLLVTKLVDVAKCIIKFEGLPITHVKLDNEAIAAAKSHIYVSAYWFIRSSLACSSQITDLKAMKPEQVYSSSTTIAAWELSSLTYRLSSICSRLKQQVDACHQQIEAKVHQKLLNLFKETYIDNQEVLHLLFALKDDLPLKDCFTQAKVSVSELKNKVVILLVSKPELLPLEELLLLVHQTYDHPQNKKIKESYEIVWVPISFSNTWTDSEERSFDFLSNSLPWHSVRQPWLLNSAVVNYIKQAWNYQDEPVMVVLDSQGMVTNSNAIDMVLIWGTARAHPFSSSRENELWEEEKWILQLMFNEIDPLLTKWVEDGKNICIYGSDNLDWIRELNAKMKEIKGLGVQLEMVYVGKSNPSEQVRNILAIINEEMHRSLLSFTKLRFFWLRLESMRRSIVHLGKTTNSDHILKEVTALLDMEDNDKGWAVIGRGSSTDTVKLQGRKLMECLNLFPEWGENVAKLGFLGALRTSLEPPLPAEPCNHSSIVPYAEGLAEGNVICERCKRLMKTFVVYE